MEKHNTPQLRFPEFSGEWKEIKLGDIGRVLGGLTYNPNDISEKGVLVLRSSNIQNNLLSFNDNVYVKAKNYEAVKEDDILICVRNGSKNLIGKNAIITKEAEGLAFGAFMSVFRSKQNKFIHQLFSTELYNKTIQKNLGATINSINGSELKVFKFHFPAVLEQQKIVAFLSATDKKLAQLQQKRFLLEQYKKGMMQKLFSQEIRFKDDNGKEFPEWEEKELGNLYNITSSKRVFQNEWTNSGVPFFRAREIVKLSENGFVKNELFISNEMYEEYKEKYGVPKKDDLLVTGVGTIGILYVVRDEERFYFKDGNIIWFKTTRKVNSSFVKFLFQTRIIRTQIENNASITTVGTYTIDSAKKTKIPFPSLKEQTKIADLLTAIDNKINAVSTQVAKANAFKKGLLQQMFV